MTVFTCTDCKDRGLAESDCNLCDQFTELDIADRKEEVNHPSHYNGGDIECIDAIRAAIKGLDGYAAFAEGNCIKYLWRHPSKGGITDLEKAEWYLHSLIEYERKKEQKK